MGLSAQEWAKICRTQAALSADPKTVALFLTMASEFEAITVQEALNVLAATDQAMEEHGGAGS